MFRIILDVGDYVFKGFVLADESEGGGRADFRDRVEVVAAEKDAEVDELGRVWSAW